MGSDAKEAPTVELGGRSRSTGTVSIPGAADRPIVERDPEPTSVFDEPAQRFEEVGELGRGGMGRVADAFDHVLARQVAVKYVLDSDGTALARFEREARITAQLEHPGIVPLYETGRSEDGTPYYVMRRVDGKPLEEAVRRAGLDQRLALVPNVLAACDAIAYAHARSILHRDIKPTNILLGPFGETLVIDWGLARTLGDRDDRSTSPPSDPDRVTRVGAVAGTPGFMSPEQCRGEPVDERTDVFALGATLFYTLAGEPPHAESSGPTDVIARVAGEQDPDWTRLPAEVPDDLRAIVEKALAIDPRKRYADAAALAADLRRFVTGNLVSAHRYGRFERLRRFVRRHRVATTAAVGVVMLVLVAGIAYRGVRAERERTAVARRLEADRVDELAIARARILLDTNPTHAVALVRTLARGERWREASNIVSAASARGVPWRLPSSAETRRIGISPDGVHGFSVGGDGVIRFYDLHDRTARVVAELGPPSDAKQPVLVDFVDDATLAVWSAGSIAILDLGAGSRRTIPIASDAKSASVRGGVLYWVDAAWRGWRLASGATEPSALSIDDEIETIVAAPDGSRCVVLGKKALWLVDASGAATQLLDERASHVTWDTGGDALLVATFRHGILKTVQLTEPPAWSPSLGRDWPEAAVMFEGRFVYQTLGMGKPALKSDSGSAIAYGARRGVGIVLSRDNLMVAGTDDGTIEIYDGERRHAMISPAPALAEVAASPRSSFVLTASATEVLLWDLDPVFARRLPYPRGKSAPQVAPGHRVFVPNPDGTSLWIDLATGQRREGPARLPMHVFYQAAPAGSAWMLGTAIDPQRSMWNRRVPGSQPLEVDEVIALRVDTAEQRTIGKSVAVAKFVDQGRVVLALTSGRIELVDLDRGSTTTLVEGSTKPTGVFANVDYVAIEFVDSTIVRVELDSGRRTTTRRDEDIALGYLGRDGRLWLADGAVLQSLELDGRLVDRTPLPSRITNIWTIDDAHLAVDTDQIGYLVDLAAPGAPRATFPLGSGRPITGVPRAIASGRAVGVLAVPNATGGARIIDGITGAHWTVGQWAPMTATARLSVDGTYLFETREGVLGVWRLDIARSREAAIDMIDKLTNAVVEDPARGVVTWR